MTSRLLLVDDDEKLLRILSMYLDTEGYQVDAVASGETGLDHLAAGDYDLVLLDVRMPGMDGFETCKRIKSDARTRSIPVVFFSALSQHKGIPTSDDAGAEHFITKPFSLSGLGSLIREVLAKGGATIA